MKNRYFLGWVAIPVMALVLAGCGKKDEQPVGSKPQGTKLSKQELSDLGTRVLKDTYKKYDSNKSCWVVQAADKTNYCMKVASVESVMTDEGEKVYLLATGESADSTKPEQEKGMVGMFAVKPENGEYKVIAQTQSEEVQGNATEGTFVQLGKDVYGWKIDKNVSDQGQTLAGVSFYGVQDGQVKDMGSVQTVYDDTAAAEPDAKVNRVTKLEGKVEVDKTDENAEHYPLTVTVSGEMDGKKLSPRKYAIQFSSQKGQYVPPKDYPIVE
ncbi:MAG: hypothetical protein IKI30_04070 [Oxalobacter sp.]|nr:hypothetical protein [Oxalobacter sp.]